METSWSNERWLAELQADSDVAWSALRERIVRGTRAYLGGRGSDGSGTITLVDDVAQETLLTVRSKLGSFRGDSRFTTWVYRIAVNVLLGELRRRRWDVVRSTQQHEQAPAWPQQPHAAVATGEEGNQIHDGRQTLITAPPWGPVGHPAGSPSLSRTSLA